MDTTELIAKHRNVYLVIAPPRTASTAFCRVLWNSPTIRYYVHEPHESSYYRTLPAEHAWQYLRQPLDLAELTGPKDDQALLIKEMTFQVGTRAPHLLGLTNHPVVFVIRDPRLSLMSRRRIRQLQQGRADFPLEQTGWTDLDRQITHCRQHGIDHMIVDASDFRRSPQAIFGQLFERLGLTFRSEYLTWQPQPQLRLSNNHPGGTDHFYTRVLGSNGLQKPDEPVPDLEDFPTTGGLRAHVRQALDLYRDLLESKHRLRPTGTA